MKNSDQSSHSSAAADDLAQPPLAEADGEDYGLDFDLGDEHFGDLSSTDSHCDSNAAPAKIVSAAVVSEDRYVTTGNIRSKDSVSNPAVPNRTSNESLPGDSRETSSDSQRWETVNTGLRFYSSRVLNCVRAALKLCGRTSIREWGDLSLVVSAGLCIVSMCGGYWGYSWFTGSLFLFLGYLICRGFAHVSGILTRIECRLESAAKGPDQHE